MSPDRFSPDAAVMAGFHPAVATWFRGAFAAPTPVQTRAWPAIAAGADTLIAAPTGSGKTLAAFLAAIDALVREGLATGLPDETRVLYVSPLKALSNDIQRNLQQPLQGIRDRLMEHAVRDVDIRAWVRTGDTPATERARMRRQPPHIVVTTPESLYILLTSESGRDMLATVRTVIVDEIHALAGSKRGAHLALSLERLAALCARPPVRIGLSATQKPIEDMARFLTGRREGCHIVDSGHVRDRDLAIELPRSPLDAVLSNEAWQEVYDRLAELAQAHRTTLVFVNTRRHAERAARFLAERLGEDAVTAHHGSLAREHRLDAEQRLKRGELRLLVATASLELGIDIGDIDLVCQLGSPRGIATLLQRVGRSGHAVGALPKGRLFPLSRDDLVECTALLDAVRADELDRIRQPRMPLDVLAQQLVAELACREWSTSDLYHCVCRAWPYRTLSHETFIAVVRMLADGYSTRRGRRGAYLHYDAVNGMLRGRKGARLTAITNGGAIPDQFDYDVLLAPENVFIGTLNEDFSFESLPGDIFQLGNTSYRILKIEQGKVYVEDARGQPPNIPFWFGEAPARTEELSAAVSRLRARIDAELARGKEHASAWACRALDLPPAAARQLIDYLAAARAALGVVPTQNTLVLERFFDETGDMHLVIHAPFGSRLNRAWGLALRKRFCRKFNFELQAAALEDTVVLSLGPTHSFPLEEVARYLNATSVRELLIQALLDAPMFAARWRWSASIALAVKRNHNGRRRPAQFQRMDAEDLLALVFPDQLACQENLTGRREIPDHPLVAQTIADCLHEVMDIEGLERVLARLETGEIQILARDLGAPSPLAQEILNARPYAFLDDAPAEERRTQAVMSRAYAEPQQASDIGRLDPAAIERVRAQARPEADTRDELHDALVIAGFLTAVEVQRGGPPWSGWLAELVAQRRATRLQRASGSVLWVAAERLAQAQAVYPDAVPDPSIAPVPPGPVDHAEALRELLRSRLEILGPVTPAALADDFALPEPPLRAALLALEQDGFVLQGRFSGADAVEWCERRLLARIHRDTLKTLRSEIEAVSAADYMRFLLHWQHLGADGVAGEEALAKVIEQLEGYPVAAAAWESEILAARVQDYRPSMLDGLCSRGRVAWSRLAPPRIAGERGPAPVRVTPVVLLPRAAAPVWQPRAEEEDAAEGTPLSAAAAQVAQALRAYGASFFTDLVHDTGLLRTQVETALGELVARGLVNADSFAGLRALIAPAAKRPGFAPRHRRRRAAPGVDTAGRWSLIRVRPRREDQGDVTAHIVEVLLRRYGVVFRKVLEREPHLPPWRELLYVLRRMEARGELRGGRFVAGFSGEQFALPEAVAALRAARKQHADEALIAVSAVDPLNLVGIITPGARVPAQPGNRILYRSGIPLAVQIGGTVSYLDQNLDPALQWELRKTLTRQRDPARYVEPPLRVS